MGDEHRRKGPGLAADLDDRDRRVCEERGAEFLQGNRGEETRLTAILESSVECHAPAAVTRKWQVDDRNGEGIRREKTKAGFLPERRCDRSHRDGQRRSCLREGTLLALGENERGACPRD